MNSVDQNTPSPNPGGVSSGVFTPDDIMAGRIPEGVTLVYDDDHYYMGSLVAEILRARGVPVILVTPESVVSAWGNKTGEQYQVQRRMIDLDVDIVTSHALTSFQNGEAAIECAYSGKTRSLAVDAVVTVTMRLPNDSLNTSLATALGAELEASPQKLQSIGDCHAPSVIAGAVYSGHRYARELQSIVNRDNRMKYDRVFFSDETS